MDDKLTIAQLIDHTLLKPGATETEINTLCDEAIKYGFFSVCVHPFFIKHAAERLSATDIKIATVIGFPLGMTLHRVKIYEAIEAVLAGADELDIVINLAEVKAKKWEAVKKEITDLITATPGTTHKIIIETHYLSDSEKISASLAVMETGAEFVKTSTGFAPSGADVRDVEMIKDATKGKIGIKAAGGIKTLQDVLSFMKAGATRIGTSSGVVIMRELHLTLEKT
ncbi:MAG: deoxyribose-phosphate aldolase [Thermodesulfovibrionia bacterium]|nr:deoxyribose-phosphate aldolase [Thermodesulfovibrionia bacterium]